MRSSQASLKNPHGAGFFAATEWPKVLAQRQLQHFAHGLIEGGDCETVWMIGFRYEFGSPECPWAAGSPLDS